MSVKSELRQTLKRQRAAVSDKLRKDAAIHHRLASSKEYQNAESVLIYASLGDEIETDTIIRRALSDGKSVAVPLCKDNSGHMDFYLIHSLDELREGAFHIREPDTNLHKRLEVFEKTIIIVPGLAFDRNGFRLGYGGGYYDRFLSDHSLCSIGLCYDEMLQEKLPRETYDLPVDIVITDDTTLEINGGKYGL